MARILLIENDAAAAQAIGRVLETKHSLEYADGADEGFFYSDNKDFDLFIIEHSPGEINALNICQRLRAKGQDVPILFLASAENNSDKIIALENGADEYLTKPINTDELLARVHVLLRRPRHLVNPELLSAGDLVLDLTKKTVTRVGQEIDLRRKEFFLLEYLIRNKGRVVSREMILSNVWPADAEPCLSAVNVHIKHLRDRIEKPFGDQIIHTIYGIGYKLGD